MDFNFMGRDYLDHGDMTGIAAPAKAKDVSWITFISGAIAGATSRTMTAPMDRLKVQM